MPRKRDAAIALLRIRPMSDHFTWTILHSSGVREGNWEAEADKMDEATLERGREERMRAAGALAGLHAQRAAHNLAMGQVKDSTIRHRNWAYLMGQGGKRKGAE